jgi:hypothetical protein
MVVVYLEGDVDHFYNAEVVPRRGEQIQLEKARYRVETVRHRTNNDGIVCEVERVENGDEG